MVFGINIVLQINLNPSLKFELKGINYMELKVNRKCESPCLTSILSKPP